LHQRSATLGPCRAAAAAFGCRRPCPPSRHCSRLQWVAERSKADMTCSGLARNMLAYDHPCLQSQGCFCILRHDACVVNG
jgi:hypothetical protein